MSDLKDFLAFMYIMDLMDEKEDGKRASQKSPRHRANSETSKGCLISGTFIIASSILFCIFEKIWLFAAWPVGLIIGLVVDVFGKNEDTTKKKE